MLLGLYCILFLALDSTKSIIHPVVFQERQGHEGPGPAVTHSVTPLLVIHTYYTLAIMIALQKGNFIGHSSVSIHKFSFIFMPIMILVD